MFKLDALEIEEVKRLNMVDFLSRHYGLDFSKGSVLGHSGGQGQYCCLSPFKEERNPSFFVREVDDHWLFKDFCSGHGGSLIDFVLLKEGFSQVSEALNHIGRLLVRGGKGKGKGKGKGEACSDRAFEFSSTSSSAASLIDSSPTSWVRERKYDINRLYSKFRHNDVGNCRDYLFKRGISEELIADLCTRGYLVHNTYKNISYCCFAVFDHSGQLCCLDNHEIDGEGKFVLGNKHPFSMDWANLASSERVFVTESIIDYLSLKTLEGINIRGIALLGNVINFSSSLFPSAIEIVSAFDGDAGGFSAFLDLEESFNGKVSRVSVYDFGDSKDANEHLQAQNKRKKSRHLSAQDKLLLYQDFQRCANKSKLAKKWGINRSYMYEVINECEDLIVSGFSQRRRGRKSGQEPGTLAEAGERLKNLEEENRRLDEERERHYVRNEFMKIRLKWAERELAEMRGEVEEVEEVEVESEVEAQSKQKSSPISKNRKKHLKKKKKRKS
jgi:DNA primase